MYDVHNPTLKSRLVDGPAIGVFWFALGSTALIEAAVAAGAEAIVIDMQHGLFDRLSLEVAIGLVPPHVPCLVRVEDDTATAIGRALDAGAEGIIVPLVESGASARQAAGACHYPPKGHRSGGGVRPLRDFTAYRGSADRAITVGVMIETRAGVENAEAIVGSDNVDFVFLGTGDLALSLGGGQDATGAHEDACRSVLEACKEAGKPCGIFTPDADSAVRRVGEGYAMSVAANDISAINDAFADAAGRFRDNIPG